MWSQVRWDRKFRVYGTQYPTRLALQVPFLGYTQIASPKRKI